jgi:23S rRNA pseudouridine1911/1915/1917 synthase
MEYRELQKAEYDDLSSRILYEDNHILIINKKVGEIVQGDKTGDETVADKYKALIAKRDGKPGKVFLGIPHRLDRPVSGITILAKTSKALERLTGMFREGQVHKIYWALCCQAPAVEESELDNYLVRNERINKSFIAKGPVENAKEAKLKYKLIGKTERYFLLEVLLLTGRHHQIRCQLAGIGCKIKGDLKYGAPRSNPDGGICLHSRKVVFVHPVTKKEITVTAPVPESWKGVEEFE